MSNRNLIQNIFSLGIVQIANYVLPLVSIPIIVRIIGPGNYGIINYYYSFVAYFILLINYGFEYSGTRFIAIEKNNLIKRNQHFTKILCAKILLFFISLLIFSVAIFYISKTESETKLAFYTFLITISWVLSPNWFYQGMQELRQVALFNFLSRMIFTILILVIIRERSSYIWQPLILSLTQIFISLVSLVYAIKKFNISLQKINFQAVLDLLWDDRMIFFSMVATNLYTDTNIVILGFYESKEHVGYFTAAWKLIFVFLVVISFPISQALFPFIAHSFSKNIDRGIGQIKRILPVIIYLSLGFSLVLYLSAGVLIHGFYGSQFTPTITVFRILTIVPVLSFINSTLGLQTMVNLKMDKAYFSIVFSGGIFSVVFNIIIIHFYGYVGCAWSWIVAEIIIAIIQNWYLKSKGYNLFQLGNFNPRVVALEFRTLITNFKKQRAG